MAFFKRSKKKSKKEGSNRSERSKDDVVDRSSDPIIDPMATSPQRVGIVSGILTTTAEMDGPSNFRNIVDRRFGPEQDKIRKPAAGDRTNPKQKSERLEHLRAVAPLPLDNSDSPKLEIDPMAHIGHATTITGNIVAEEDLEIEGTIEGSVRLVNHQITVGKDGLVKATVEAHTVLVLGRITGNVIATDLVEIKAGGIIGGDVKSKRVIMHDGAIVVGSLDMGSAMPSSAAEESTTTPTTPTFERPKLKRVELPRESSLETSSEDGQSEVANTELVFPSVN